MKTDDLDKSVEDLQKTINQIFTKDIENFFMENYPDKWTKLTDKQKQTIKNEIQIYRDNPQYKSRIRKISDKLKYFESIKFNLGILFLGVILGISGNLVANLFDRYFVKFGFIYDIVVTVIFFSLFWYIERKFIKKVSEEIMSDKTALNLLSILEKFEEK